MKVLLLLGFVAVALAEVTRFDGEKVFRLRPQTEEHVAIIKEIAEGMEVDFWNPESPDLVDVDSDVDIHVNAAYADIVDNLLQQSELPHEVLVDDLQDAVDGQMDSQEISPRSHNYMKYNTWEKIEAWISSMASANPSLISKQVIGTTFEGRSMTVLKIGKKSSSTKPAIFLDCGIHAREWISPAFCQWFVNEAVSTYGSDAEMTTLLDQMDVIVLPVFNIDGYVYTWTNNRMWRKTRSRRSGSSCIGADPNRNFDAGWCTTGASSNPCSDTYCGSKAESEVEVKAVADYIRQNLSIIKAYLTVHSYSQLLLFPYSYTYQLAEHHSELMSVAEGAAKALRSLYGTRYTSGPGAATIYPAAGGSDDWAYDLGVKYSYTFELRDTGRYGFLLPESQIKPTCEETMLAVKYIAAHVLKNLY
ncbi:carboxypeptidase B [Megalops cyprinoides]|uniref:carboxypeptidase B n=1 Tax=Megalops cyprinoides TaxID=118141 RepID=UPI0018649059|nr:carboxypeptidase B [Megalops cyprinoides]